MLSDGSRRISLQYPSTLGRVGAVSVQLQGSVTHGLYGTWGTHFCATLRISYSPLWDLGPLVSSLCYCRHPCLRERSHEVKFGQGQHPMIQEGRI